MLQQKKKIERKKKKRAGSRRGRACVCSARERAPPADLVCLVPSREQSITSLIAMEITLPPERCGPICPVNHDKNVRQTRRRDGGEPPPPRGAKHSLYALTLLHRKGREGARAWLSEDVLPPDR